MTDHNELLDRYLAQHCAPTLLGAKSASLVSVPQAEFPFLTRQLEEYNRRYAACGLVFRRLCRCRSRVLLMAYRPALLRQEVAAPRAAAMLARAGYAPGLTLEQMLDRLEQRFAEGGDFPHEIGLFLGYPPEDVEAFVLTGGKGCKLCGYWKVYHDVEAAKARFASFDACRNCLCRILETGMTISQLLCAA